MWQMKALLKKIFFINEYANLEKNFSEANFKRGTGKKRFPLIFWNNNSLFYTF